MRSNENQLRPYASSMSIAEVIEVARIAQQNEAQFARIAASLPRSINEQLYRTAKRYWASRPNDRGLLRCLLQALRRLPKAEAARLEAERIKAARRLAFASHREESAALSSLHPLGYLIGNTPVVSHLSPGTKKHWGTRRKRRK